ncbi:spore coat polysaccharide biosynthesis predicted glycosyltransferase SpsG [Pseudosporangium ferrugineum]|uniref:Spore coat polysaccharide biosynthesis predicted glycosyltransferase SpsG n=2 Tax=Pseudosporangium ferrugineum TaxID=439699 RepID=A0A2T0S827_9ACTN|nr:spore coat polysaccharide biosynthesis predicted glycosyltransferase SpsG [Pseudosporangium ferrugineum]
MTATIGIRCDAGTRTGVGHLMRCLALAEELTARGASVHLLGDLGGLEWAERQVSARGLPRHPAPGDPHDLAGAADRLGLDAVVVDSYELPASHVAAVRDSGRPVLAVVDGDLRGLPADIFVDQNLDAELARPGLPPGAVRLAGLEYALLRRAIRELRPPSPPAPSASPRPRVLAFFGGTDAYRAAPVVARLLIRTGVDCAATVVAADPRLRADLLALEPAASQHFEIIDPTDDLPRLLAEADLVISASGTSTWELLCLGRPAALVWVVDNQLLGYGRTTARGLAAGLGHLPALRDSRAGSAAAVDVLRGLLVSPAARAGLATRAWAAVDGQGCSRVSDALLAAAARRLSPR